MNNRNMREWQSLFKRLVFDPQQRKPFNPDLWDAICTSSRPPFLTCPANDRVPVAVCCLLRVTL